MKGKLFYLKLVIDNLAVSVAMALTASIISGIWDKYTLICIPLTFVISIVVSLLIPVGKITDWFASLFKIKPNTILSNIVGSIFTNIFFTLILSYSCKLLIFKDLYVALIEFLKTCAIMYVVSYFVFIGMSTLTNYMIKKSK